MSKIMNKVKELRDAVEEETGQEAKIQLSLYDHWSENSFSQFGEANKVANQLANALEIQSKEIWSNDSVYGINMKKHGVDLSIFFNGPESLNSLKKDIENRHHKAGV